MSEPTLIERLKHFEEYQLGLSDPIGAEVLHRAASRVAQLEAEREKLKLKIALTKEGLEKIQSFICRLPEDSMGYEPPSDDHDGWPYKREVNDHLAQIITALGIAALSEQEEKGYKVVKQQCFIHGEWNPEEHQDCPECATTGTPEGADHE